MKINKKLAFTLAEVLITLTAIAFVAIITLPMLNAGVDKNVIISQKETFDAKLKESFHSMQRAGELVKDYESTADFVDSMKKHMKISKTCASNKLSDCFTSKILTKNKETKYDLNNVSSSNDINAGFGVESDVIGLVFADGTSAIITHNPNCIVKEIYDGDADVTKCISMLYDINGKNAPNVFEADIYELTSGESYNLSFNILSNKVYSKNEFGYENNSSGGFATDYWLGAKSYCEKNGGNLPTPENLEEIAEKLYGNANCNVSTKNGRIYYSGCDKNKVTQNPLWSFVSQARGFWTNDTGYFRAFSETSSDYNNDSNWRSHSWDGGSAFCVK